MILISDEGGQSAAEYILLFAAVIFFAILALWIYRAYFEGNLSIANDINEVRDNLKQ
ncbi:MAG: hypothetical protein PWQ74_63 [Methanobacteriaceae archaeon]|nr:hypothetical protein [Methanobacteriaceae archaeon]